MDVYHQIRAVLNLSSADLDLLREHQDTLQAALDSAVQQTVVSLQGLQDVGILPEVTGRLGSLSAASGWLKRALEPNGTSYARDRLSFGANALDGHFASPYIMGVAHRIFDHVRADIETRFTGPEGSRIHDAFVRMMFADIALLLAGYEDVQRRRTFKELHALIADSLNSIVFLLDENNHIVEMNQSAKAQLQLNPDQPLHLADQLRANQVGSENLLRSAAQCLLVRREQEYPTVPVRIGDERRWYHVTLHPIVHDQVAWMIVGEDCTQAVNAERQRRENEALARLGSMSAAVAHELRNPLAGISGALQVIRETLPEEDPNRDIMGLVVNQVERLDSLVRDLQSFARAPQVQIEQATIAPLVRRAEGQYEGELAWHVQGDTELHIDEVLLVRALHVLAQNANQAGAKNMTVHLSPGAIDIRDDGPGIRNEHVEKVFEPFFSTKTQGTGLGLAIAHRLVDAMNGDLKLVEPAQAHFRLHFPRDAAE